MIGIARDCVRAVLVLVVLAVSLEMLQAHRESAADPRPWQPVQSWPQDATERPAAWPQPQAAPPAWQPASAPAWQQPPQTVVIQPAPPAQPIRRVAGSVVDLADSLIGVIR